MDDPLRVSGRLANSELRCKNSCGFYGNPMWDGYCSKCYKELKVQTPTTPKQWQTSSGESFADDLDLAQAVAASQGTFSPPNATTSPNSLTSSGADTQPTAAASTAAVQQSARQPEAASKAFGLRRAVTVGENPSGSPALKAKFPLSMSRSSNSAVKSDGASPRTSRSLSRKSSTSSMLGKSSASPASSTTAATAAAASTESKLPTLGFAKFEEKKRARQQSKKGLRLFKGKGKGNDSTDSTAVSTEAAPANDERTKAAADLTELLKTMKKPVNQDITLHTKNFIRRVLHNSSELKMDAQAKLVQQFYQWVDNRMQTSTIYRNVSGDQQKVIMDNIERYLMACTYTSVWASRSKEDEEKDKQLSARLRRLQWVSPAHLEIIPVTTSTKAMTCLQRAQHELLTMDDRRAPSEKLRNVSQCCKHIFNALMHSSGGAPASADDFLPVLIYVVLQAAAPRLHSNIQYISEFSNQDNLLSGESGYHFTNLCCAVSFLENATAETLHVSRDEFDGFMTPNKTTQRIAIGSPRDESDSGAVLPESPALQSLRESLQRLKELGHQQDKQVTDYQQLKKEFALFRASLVAQVEEALKPPAPVASHSPPPQ